MHSSVRLCERGALDSQSSVKSKCCESFVKQGASNENTHGDGVSVHKPTVRPPCAYHNCMQTTSLTLTPLCQHWPSLTLHMHTHARTHRHIHTALPLRHTIIHTCMIAPTILTIIMLHMRTHRHRHIALHVINCH